MAPRIEAGAIDHLCFAATIATPAAERATVRSAAPAVESTNFCQVPALKA